jgi:DNA-binding transcriptional regulator YhcF (GntR family)
VTGLPAHKYAQAAAIVRAQVTDGTLKPGQPAPSGDALARLTGFSTLTCRKALRTLIRDGILTPGPSPSARPRVAVPAAPRPADEADAARRLSRALAAARHAGGLTQPALSALTGYSVTAIGHAETGRLWQSRQFSEKTDLALAAGGQLTRLYDAYRADAASTDAVAPPPGPPPPVEPPGLTHLTLHWSDGTATTAYPSDFPVMTGNGEHRSLPHAPLASLTSPEPGSGPSPGRRRDSRAAYLRSPPPRG